MIDPKTLQDLLGGAFLGIIAVNSPSWRGFAYMPTHAVKLGAALSGIALTAMVYFGYVAQLVSGTATEHDATLSAPDLITSLTGMIFHLGLLRCQRRETA